MRPTISIQITMYDLENMVRVLLHSFPVYSDYMKSERLSYEFLANFYSNDELRFLLTGSFREGYPDLLHSDSDYIVIINPREEILTLEKLRSSNMFVRPLHT